MGAVTLELSKHEFDSIGALEENERGFFIAKRPFTFNMNESMVSANLPEEVFPFQTLCLLEDLSDHESKLMEQLLFESQRLSPRMKDSMETGLFWVCLAARYSSMFDEIYWTFIDRRYYGTFSC